MDATSHGDSNDTIGGRNKFIAGVIDANEQLVTNVIREYLR
jgi:hypothetical protein